jgi:hypothetical protein
MQFLVLTAYLSLIKFDIYLRRGNFSSLCEYVRTYPISRGLSQDESIERICDAVNMASIWYGKEVLCLQRSAATTCLLRRHGIDSQLVIGAQPMPFKAHAWVEVNGRVVNDKQYTPAVYAVLERC